MKCHERGSPNDGDCLRNVIKRHRQRRRAGMLQIHEEPRGHV